MAQTLAERRRVSRRLPVTASSGAGVELLPVEITPDEQKEPMATLPPLLSTPSQSTASSCKVEFRHGNFTKRLEEGQFIWPAVRDDKVSITRSQLAMLLDKLDWRQTKTSCLNALTML